jgi:hypothetical protein
MVVQGLQQLLMALHVLLLVVAAAVRVLPAVLELMVAATGEYLALSDRTVL